MMTQREAVFQAIVTAVGTPDGKVELNKSQLSDVHESLLAMFQNGDVSYRGGVPDEEKLRKYIPGLVNNWLRKDTRLNGGSKYEIKNPGSRSGAGDAQLKALKELLKVTKRPEDQRAVKQAIEQRQEALKPRPNINPELIPEHLRNLLAEVGCN